MPRAKKPIKPGRPVAKKTARRAVAKKAKPDYFVVPRAIKATARLQSLISQVPSAALKEAMAVSLEQITEGLRVKVEKIKNA